MPSYPQRSGAGLGRGTQAGNAFQCCGGWALQAGVCPRMNKFQSANPILVAFFFFNLNIESGCLAYLVFFLFLLRLKFFLDLYAGVGNGGGENGQPSPVW